MGNAKGRSDSQFYALEEKDLIASIKCSEIWRRICGKLQRMCEFRSL
jgi:hypothetical protein